jgi:hypothetical protein
MDDTPQPDPFAGLTPPIYYQVTHALTAHLPPPLTDTPQALIARNDTAIAQVAAMQPTNANEAALAVQCVATRAQAEDVLRLLRKHADDDINLVVRLNAQYVAMVRASLGAHGHLTRAQKQRHKREASDTTREADEWTQHVVGRSMQQALAEGLRTATPADDAIHAAAAQPPRDAHPPTAAGPPVQRPAPVPTVAPPPAAAAVSAVPSRRPGDNPLPVPAGLPVPSTPVPPRPSARPAPDDADEPPRDLRTEAEHYAVIYPTRAQQIRRYGGLPPDCSFGPPDDDLVAAIVRGTSPALRALDVPAAAAG